MNPLISEAVVRGMCRMCKDNPRSLRPGNPLEVLTLSDNSVQFFGRDVTDVDFDLASQCVRAFPHCTVVAMCNVPDSSGSIIIPKGEDAEYRMRPDVGVVLSAGSGVPLIPGDLVAVKHDHGKWVEGFHSGDFHTDLQVRFYGCAAMSGRKAIRVPYWRSILALIDYDNEQPLRATGKQVIIDRGDIIEKTDGGVILPSSATYRETVGTIVSTGADVPPEYRVGSKVIYTANLMLPCRGLFGYSEDGTKVPKNYGIIEYTAILAEVE